MNVFVGGGRGGRSWTLGGWGGGYIAGHSKTEIGLFFCPVHIIAQNDEDDGAAVRKRKQDEQ